MKAEFTFQIFSVIFSPVACILMFHVGFTSSAIDSLFKGKHFTKKPLNTGKDITDFINRREQKLQTRFGKPKDGEFYLKGKPYNSIFTGTDKNQFQLAFGSPSHMLTSDKTDTAGKQMRYSHQPLKSVNVLTKQNGETSVYRTDPVFGLLSLKNGNGKPTHLAGLSTSRKPGFEYKGRGTRLFTFNQKPVNPSSSGPGNNILGSSKKQNIHSQNILFAPKKKPGAKPQAKTFKNIPATSHQSSSSGSKPPGSSPKKSPWI